MQAKNLTRTALISLLFAAAAASNAAFAQDATAPKEPDHPRVNEINQRVDNQQNRIDSGVENGTLRPGQAARDEHHDANIARREHVDEAKDGGHLTKAEQHRLNKSLDHNSARIADQKK